MGRHPVGFKGRNLTRFCTDFNLNLFCWSRCSTLPELLPFLTMQTAAGVIVTSVHKQAEFIWLGRGPWKAEEHEESDWLCFEYSTYNWTRVAVPQNLLYFNN